MADKKNEDPKTEEKPVGIDKAGVLKLLRDRKVEIVGRKGVSETGRSVFRRLGRPRRRRDRRRPQAHLEQIRGSS